MRHYSRFSAVCILLASLLLALPALAAPGDTLRVSVSSSGEQGNNQSSSTALSISADGRYVVFESWASNLVAGDTNGTSDIFFHDRTTGATQRASVASSGTQGNAPSRSASISPDGRFIAFESAASNLVAGDTNGRPDIFVHDRITGTTERVSVDSSGGQGSGISIWYPPALSGDGRYVAFESTASTLVPGDTNGMQDIFVRDRTTGTTERISVATGGTQGSRHSFSPSISADGRYVAFESESTNLVPGDTNGLSDVFVHDRTTGTTERVSVDSSGGQGNGLSVRPSISSSGRYVVFDSSAANLVNGDTNGSYDVFVHDRTTRATTRVSVVTGGGQTNESSWYASISADGRYVAFQSHAGNLVPGNIAPDVFVHDRTTGVTVRASEGRDRQHGNGTSAWGSLSADGRYVAFQSFANNLVPGDSNGTSDVFIHETDYSDPLPTPTSAGGGSLPDTGFAADRVTLLAPQTISYNDPGDLWLEIPKLHLKMPIVGVPRTGTEWNVSWLGSNAGWLEGSAFPSWAGNSVLTGHAWNADNSPGPFLKLNTLWWDENVIVHAFGQQSIYKVRSVQQVAPTNFNAMMKHEDLPWLTLVTCRGYDEGTNSYRYRIIVRAVLVEVK
jgi:LPXTG-site transpeptidase (sortase) family protein